MFLCMWNRICLFLGIIFNFYFDLYVFNSGRVVLQKRQVIVTFLGCLCRHSEVRPSESWLLKFMQHLLKDEGGWGGGWQRYGYGTWTYGLHTKPRWETDVEIHEGKFVQWWCWWWEWRFSENVLVTKVPNIKQAKTHQPKMALGDVMCGFPGLV